ncbi:MAG: TatD family hydrolase [Anaerolineaceae bacterium]|nr:TatD family hydrolase [Anaerolineaceae bacterium]
MTSFYDTHCHLYMKHFGNEVDQVVQNTWNEGVSNILVPGIDIQTSKTAIKLAEKYEYVYAAVGIHPHDADSVPSDWQEQLIQLSAHPKVVAIGEIGLDFYRNYSPADIQKEIFQSQLEIALQVQKPIIFHERNSALEIWQILENFTERFISTFNKEWGVFHSFGSTMEFAMRAIENKLMIGVSGPITYKTAHEKRNVIAALPLTSLLLETDAPYLTPHPHRGKRNSPEYIPIIAEKISELKQCKIEDVGNITSSNADRLFSWRSVH